MSKGTTAVRSKAEVHASQEAAAVTLVQHLLTPAIIVSLVFRPHMLILAYWSPNGQLSAIPGGNSTGCRGYAMVGSCTSTETAGGLDQSHTIWLHGDRSYDNAVTCSASTNLGLSRCTTFKHTASLRQLEAAHWCFMQHICLIRPQYTAYLPWDVLGAAISQCLRGLFTCGSSTSTVLVSTHI